ncbi:MAG: DUF2283 domain-containing protein [Candidatus Dormibacteria bacterium]|jgi:uncharacterized protein YuzE
MHLEHDREADAVYITLREGTYAYGDDLGSERRIDYESSGEPLGIELLNVSQGVDVNDLPQSEEVGMFLAAHDIPIFA